MIVFAIVGIVLAALWIIFGSIAKKKIALSKFPVLLLIACIATLVISGQISKNNTNTAVVQHYQEVAPPIQYAPRVVQTSSRIYYVAVMQDDGQILTLQDYYFYDNKWEHSDKPLPLDRKIYGKILIYNRS
jgi:hypothetical protein